MLSDVLSDVSSDVSSDVRVTYVFREQRHSAVQSGGDAQQPLGARPRRHRRLHQLMERVNALRQLRTHALLSRLAGDTWWQTRQLRVTTDVSATDVVHFVGDFQMF